MRRIIVVRFVLFFGLITDSFLALGAAVSPIKGLISVRKDGKGDFKRIVPALMVSEPKDVIEIQDSSVYREILNLASFPNRTIRAKKGEHPTLLTNRSSDRKA